MQTHLSGTGSHHAQGAGSTSVLAGDTAQWCLPAPDIKAENRSGHSLTETRFFLRTGP